MYCGQMAKAATQPNVSSFERFRSLVPIASRLIVILAALPTFVFMNPNYKGPRVVQWPNTAPPLPYWVK